MVEDKMIEEMAFFIFENSPLTNLSSEDLAKDLYEEGYRKYGDGSIIIPKLSNEDIENIRNTLKNSAPCIIPIEKNQEWVSVDERLPEDADERVLVYIVSERSYTELDTDRFVCGRWVRWGDEVTHWMPLPQPPETKGETE